jgi:predicted site-specific integrase-resolvase
VKQITPTPDSQPQLPLDSPQTFAKAIRVTPQSVRNWIHAGIIPCVVNCGKIMRFDRRAALAALAGNERRTSA